MRVLFRLAVVAAIAVLVVSNGHRVAAMADHIHHRAAAVAKRVTTRVATRVPQRLHRAAHKAVDRVPQRIREGVAHGSEHLKRAAERVLD